jgi:hypothetical protein
MTMIEIAIDPEFRALIPAPTAEEQAQLEANLLAEGCRDQLAVWMGTEYPRVCPDCQAEGAEVSLHRVQWEDHERWNEHYGCLLFECPSCQTQIEHPWTVLDGHSRWEICAQHHLRYAVVEVKGLENREDAKIWILRNQFGRRNLTPYQRAELALKLEPLMAARAQAQERTHTAAGYQKSDNPVHTLNEMGKVAGVSHDTMHKAKVITQEADEPTKQALRRGDRSIHHVYQTLRPRRAASHEKVVPETSASTLGVSPAMALAPQVRLAKRVIELADAMLHALGTWRQEFP